MNVGLFDKYSLEARLRPALFVWLPLFLTVAVWIPALYQTAAGFVGLVIACGLTVVLAHYARARGRAAQVTLVSKWGAMPTTIWLRHSDTQLESATKLRYHQFLENQIPGWVAPSREQEYKNPEAADAAYSSAVKWLLEWTRDTSKYPLVFAENISYGFRRNMYGMKPVGLMVASGSLAFACWQFFGPASLVNIGTDLAETGAGFISLLALIWWFLGVTDSWVKDAADAYARALLSACESRSA